MPHLYPTRALSARNVLRQRIPDLSVDFPTHLMGNVPTHGVVTKS